MPRIYEFYAGRTGIALLMLRLVFGVGMMFHGWQKLQDVGAFAGKMNLPHWLGSMVACFEFGGGLLMVLGLLTPFAALAVICVMLGALFTVHWPAGDPFVNPGGKSWELASLYLIANAGLALTGPGYWSADRCLVHALEQSPRAAAWTRNRGTAA